jgi:hypothetical protein
MSGNSKIISPLGLKPRRQRNDTPWPVRPERIRRESATDAENISAEIFPESANNALES